MNFEILPFPKREGVKIKKHSLGFYVRSRDELEKVRVEQAALMLLIQPTEEMSKQIRVELNENVATRDKDLEMIKEWLAKQPHLPKFDDDQRIMTFLRGCKFSLEKCKRKLDMYFTMRAIVPEFFSNRDITRPSLQEIVKLVHIPPLPGLTYKGCRVIVMRGIDKDVPTPNIPEAMKIVFMIGDIRLKEEEHGVAGDVYILDAAVATPIHFAKFTPPVVKKFLVCAMEAYPVKLKEVHVINISPLVDTILNFVKPFLKEKIRNRIFMHSDIKTLYDYIPREILPAEYGGDAGPIQNIHDMWMKKLEDYGPWFAEQEAMKTNEALRPGKPKTQDDLFGLDGSFRQLSID
ncbi:Alpha-tocopherol transfer protein-like protein [Trachymyrmex cornetzi]|uniref:Alpha-tocopherol transfer protein-like protein n=1 Tax=Trachymyrmex cornetzi TaxID=471704 RepID=A0A195ECA1_9HYME|nr:Alpha-tocopherol transfer protein-like protein [Trachymyrmex cornetzi]